MTEPREHHESAWRLHHAKLDAALVRGICAPRLDGTFDRAVWARIAEQQQAALRSPADLSQRLRRNARLTIVNWLAGGVVAAGASAMLVSAVLSSTSLAAFSAMALPAALALGGVIAVVGLATVSPLGGLVRRYL